MKHLLPISVFMLLLFSCKKEDLSKQEKNNFLQKIKLGLRDSLSVESFALVDFSRVVHIRMQGDTQFVRMGIKDKNFSEEFVMVQTNPHGQIIGGRKVELTGRIDNLGTFNGKIALWYLNGHVVLNSTITKGYIDELHEPVQSSRVSYVHDPFMLPDVVVYATRKPDEDGRGGGSAFLSLQSLYGDAHGYIDYSSSYSNGGSGGGGYYTPVSGYDENETDDDQALLRKPGIEKEETAIVEDAVLIDFESGVSDPAIDIKAYLNCFAKVPDAGAVYSIELFADIPVDTDPNKLFNFESGSPGHTFLQLKKSNGVHSVVQNFGFYPKAAWKNIFTNAPMEGKFVDNGNHEFNASIKMTLKQKDFILTLFEIQSVAKSVKYDIDDYNCTDFALNVFNKCRTDKLKIPLYDIPGNYPSTGTSTPQGLYHTLKQMKNSGNPERENIAIDIYKGWVASSTGPCN